MFQAAGRFHTHLFHGRRERSDVGAVLSGLRQWTVERIAQPTSVSIGFGWEFKRHFLALHVGELCEVALRGLGIPNIALAAQHGADLFEGNAPFGEAETFADLVEHIVHTSDDTTGRRRLPKRQGSLTAAESVIGQSYIQRRRGARLFTECNCRLLLTAKEIVVELRCFQRSFHVHRRGPGAVKPAPLDHHVLIIAEEEDRRHFRLEAVSGKAETKSAQANGHGVAEFLVMAFALGQPDARALEALHPAVVNGRPGTIAGY